MTPRPALLALALLACGGPRPSPGHDLVLADEWLPGDADSDPWPGHRPATVACGPAGAYVEGATFEVATEQCDYLDVRQPSVWRLRAGDGLQVAFTHTALLTAPDDDLPREAHVALQLGDELLWELIVPIPAVPTPHTVDLTLAHDHELDEPWSFHLHNHGANTYSLLHVRAR